MKKLILLVALSACTPPADYELECTPIHIEDGAFLPCNTPETVYGAEDVLLKYYSKDAVSDIICTPLRLFPSGEPPQDYVRGRYNGLAHPYGKQEIHLRLLGPDLSKTAIYHEYFAHMLPFYTEGNLNVEHSTVWADKEKELTDEIFETKVLFPDWCEE